MIPVSYTHLLLISSHQLQQIQQVCDRVGIFVEGSLIASGTLKELEEQIRKDGGYLLELEVLPCDDKILGMLYQQPGVQLSLIHISYIRITVRSLMQVRSR